MAFVLDASTAIAWALREDHPPAAVAGELIATEAALAPALWWFELRNGLIVNERRGRITAEATRRFLQHVAELPIALDRVPDEAAVMTLARRHRLTVYDASYLELALREAVPLATLDRPLAEAARAEGVVLVGG